jgi:hypothetical protein
MKLVVIESPYGTNPDGSPASPEIIERNTLYLCACIDDCLRRDEAPFASHGMYTLRGILDDSDLEERRRGMLAGWAWQERADLVVCYVDLGITSGMRDGCAHALNIGKRIEHRELGGRWMCNKADVIACPHTPKHLGTEWCPARQQPEGRQ